MRAVCGIEQDAMPLRSTSVLSRSAARRIELALHQPVHQMQQRHGRAGLGEAVGRLEPEQAAADHDDALLLRRQRQQQVDVAACRGRCARRRDRRRAR